MAAIEEINMSNIKVLILLAAFYVMPAKALEIGHPHTPFYAVFEGSQSLREGTPIVVFNSFVFEEKKVACTRNLISGISDEKLIHVDCINIIMSGWRLVENSDDFNDLSMITFLHDERDFMIPLPPISYQACVDYYSSPSFDSNMRPLMICGLTQQKFGTL